MNAAENLHHQNSVSWRTRLDVVALGVSSFTIVTTELAPIGLLSPLATEFGQTEGKAGLVVTAYGWIAALAALASVIFLGRIPRKPLLVSLMVVLAIALTVQHLSVSSSIGIDVLTQVPKNRAFRRIYLSTACAITAHFAAFTFIEPLLSNVAAKAQLSVTSYENWQYHKTQHPPAIALGNGSTRPAP